MKNDHGLVDGGELRRIVSRSEIPEGAIILRDQEVITLQWKRVHNWKPKLEMWPITHGPVVLAIAGMASGAMTSNYFRKMFQLRHYGRLASYIPTLVCPAMFSFVWHNMLITNNMLLGKYNCSLCAQMKSGLLQLWTGALVPCFLAPPVCVILARKYYTYTLPSLTQPEVLNFMKSTVFPFKSMLAGIVLWQFVMGAVIAERESRVFYEVLCKEQSKTKDLDKLGGFS